MKISRDKRGYETYYLLEPGSDRSRQSRPRILFWFRTPPQVKVGREPFSEEIRQAIESQNPDLTFDWAQLTATSPPPPDVQLWRERRRLERAARQAAREEPEPDVAGADASVPEDLPVDDVDPPRHSIEAVVDADALEHPDRAARDVNHPAAPAVSGGPASDSSGAPPSPPRPRRRRRRRGRKHGPAQADGTAPQPPLTEPPPSSDEV